MAGIPDLPGTLPGTKLNALWRCRKYQYRPLIPLATFKRINL